jgi:ubiquinone/menaquinone biosynthesis C-methylase UbiE
MGFYNDHILPRLTHWSLDIEPVAKVRARVLASAQGIVLEAGFGSGLNLAHYPAGVTRLLAVEPSEVARRMARKAIARAAFPVEFAGLDGQSLNLSAASVDCVVSTFTLCTIPDAARALAEFARVLKPGGTLLFAEHGLSPEAGVAKWQHRLNGIQQRIGGGCNLNRKMDALIAASPLKITELENFHIKGPKTHTYLYVGRASKG